MLPRTLIAISVTLAGLCALPARANEPGPLDGPAFQGAPAAVLHAAEATPVAAGAEYVVLLDEGEYVFDADGRHRSSFHQIVRITGQHGIDAFSSLQVAWSPWIEDRPVLRARVIRPDGSAQELDPSTISEAPLGPESLRLYTDARALRAPLPSVASGVVIETEVRRAQKIPYPLGGQNFSFSVGTAGPVARTRLFIDADSAVPLHLATLLLPGVTPVRSEAGGRTRLTYEIGTLEPLSPPEPGLPRDVPAQPFIAMSTARTWGEIAARYSQIIDAQIGRTDLSARAREAAGGEKDPRKLAARLLAYLHREVRYVGLELGQSSIVPHPPQETLTQRYGDCKDQATLLVALLRALGVKARVALLNAGSRTDILPDLPGGTAFDHAIVYVPGKQPLWIDPTNEFAHAGELPMGDQGRLALVAAPDTTALLRTPESRAADNRVVHSREILLSEIGQGRFTETSTLTGADERVIRDTYHRLSERQIREEFTSYATAQFGAKAVTELHYGDPRDLSGAFQIRMALDQVRDAVTGDDDAVTRIRLGPLVDVLPDAVTKETKGEEKPRVADFDSSMAFQREWRYRIVPPPGFRPLPLPASGTSSLGPATLTQSFAVDTAGAVIAEFRFELGKRRLSKDEFTALRLAVRALFVQEAPAVRFERTGAALLSAGRVREALAENRRLIALHPAEALHHLQYALVLLQVGMGGVARQEADRAVELEPGSALAQRLYGFVLEHDLLGRLRKPGYDLASATAAYRRALTLDDKDQLARTNLGLLLGFGPDGQVLTDPAHLGESIGVLRAVPKEADIPLARQVLLERLMRSGRFEELVTAARPMPCDPRRDALLLAGVAAQSGAAAALVEAQRLPTDREKQKAALEQGGGLLMAARHYPEARALYEAGTRGSSGSAALLEVLRRTRPYEHLEMPREPALALARTQMIEQIRRDAPAPGEGLPVDAFIDLTLAELSFAVEGDAAGGYRVVVSKDGKQRMAVFVSNEGGVPRLVETSAGLARLGREALRRADAGDLAGARRWLDWAWSYRDQPQVGDVSARQTIGLWPPGTAGDATQVRVAAADLMSLDAETAAQALPILQGCRRTGPAPALCGQSVLMAQLVQGQGQEALATLLGLSAAAPDSLSGYQVQVRLLKYLGRDADARRLTLERLRKLPDDADALRFLSVELKREGDYAGADARLRRLIELGKADPGDYNNVAWLQLFLGTVTERALADARRAVEAGDEGGQRGHTLAALYAESGKPLEALEALRQSLAHRSGGPMPHDFYVLGRIAEEYGLQEVAAAAYRKVERPAAERDLAISSYVLAQRRAPLVAADR